MPTLKLTLEYDGTAFSGWQRQLNARTIQAEVEAALKSLHSGDAIHAIASGRTDAGVHARAQVVSFRTQRELPLRAYERGLNTLLSDDVAVRGVEFAPEAFDARRWSRGKRYIYRVLRTRFRSPLRGRYTWMVHRGLDVPLVQQAAAHLLGTHDFNAFRASDCEAKTTVREMRVLDVTEDGDEVVFRLEATAFLKHMVRNIVGTLVEVGVGKRDPASIPQLLTSLDRTQAGRTAPPQGLCLDEVFYDLAKGPPSKDLDERGDE